jgi:hypothetical protein
MSLDPRFVAQLLVIGFTFFMLLNSAAVLVYMERKVAALVQQRYGPYLVGPRGLLQPLADIIKLMFKEELRPRAADSILFYAAPILSAAAAFAAFAVVPFGADTTFFGLLDEPISLVAGGGNRGHGRLRDRPRWVELEQQVFAARRPAIVGADDQLRAVVRAVVRGRDHDGRIVVARHDRGRAGGLLVRVHPALVRLPAAGRLHHLPDCGGGRDEPGALRLSGG